MKRFRFRLRRLERLRDVRRRQARALEAQALNQVRLFALEREARERVLVEALSEEPPASGPLDPAAFRARADWHEGLSQGLRRIALAEREARDRARQAAARHALAARDHRVLERLRERQHARWISEAELESQKFLDEIHRTCKKREAGGDDA